jgi:hypothetical protein
LRCEISLWLFRRHRLPTEIEGLGQTSFSRDRIPQELDGDPAERRDGNVPFASRLTALLSMMDHWLNRLLAAKSHFGGSSNGGFWSGKVQNA